MNKYSYYTPIGLAEEIVKLLPRRKYNSVIDICCGTCNLLSAAKKEFPNANFYGVDIDENIAEYIFDGARFTLGDGREFSDREKKVGRTYDVILSNPPFGKLEDSDVYWNKKREDKEYSSLRCKRYEAEMMLANIYLAHENSVLLFILPITFVTGEKYKEARRQIAETFAILEIIELPINTFKGNRLKTVAIIIKKTVDSSNRTNFKKAILNNNMWQLNQISKISNKAIKLGNWTGEKKDTINIQIKRGKIHSGEMDTGDNVVLHCSSIYEGGEWKPSIRYTDQSSNIRAEYGDILVNRIGKGAGYWCINQMHNVEVSDCLYVIKNIKEEIIKKLCDNTVGGKLNITKRGVSTMYITQADICHVINS